jgi:hypothetical protein
VPSLETTVSIPSVSLVSIRTRFRPAHVLVDAD